MILITDMFIAFLYVLLGLGDVQFDLRAYLHAGASVVAQAIYLTYVQKTGVEKEISALSVLHLNSINCIPFMLCYTLISGNLQKSMSFPYLESESFLVS